jgi:hypothetical protein
MMKSRWREMALPQLAQDKNLVTNNFLKSEKISPLISNIGIIIYTLAIEKGVGRREKEKGQMRVLCPHRAFYSSAIEGCYFVGC